MADGFRVKQLPPVKKELAIDVLSIIPHSCVLRNSSCFCVRDLVVLGRWVKVLSMVTEEERQERDLSRTASEPDIQMLGDHEVCTFRVRFVSVAVARLYCTGCTYGRMLLRHVYIELCACSKGSALLHRPK